MSAHGRRGIAVAMGLALLTQPSAGYSESGRDLRPASEPPQRALDLRYGAALYEYYQNRPFEALIELSVADQQGGIQGHGDHPDVLRGGMLLAWGMTETAREIFESAVGRSLQADTRNLAWFYLGKMSWLERDFEGASSALGKVDHEAFSAEEPELWAESVYYRGQIAIENQDEAAYATALEQLPEESAWRPYLQYNHALLAARNGEPAQTAQALAAVLDLDFQSLPAAERWALKDQIQLTRASYLLDLEQPSEAMTALEKIRQDGPVSDQALMGYALAATHQKSYAQALQALNVLSDRPLFNPLVQQVPYARAFLYERLYQTARALEAYTDAVGRYEQQRDEIDRLINNLDQSTITGMFDLADFGSETTSTDSYGRLIAGLKQFYLADRVSTEPFQIALRDLNELFRLRTALEQKRSSLEAMKLSLETRRMQTAARMQDVDRMLEGASAGNWDERRQTLLKDMETADENTAPYYFLSAEQLDYRQKIDALRTQVEALPDDEDRAEAALKLGRIEGFFKWWASETWPVQRWEAISAGQALSRQVDELDDRRERLVELKAGIVEQAELAQRVAAAEDRLTALLGGLEEQIVPARERLLALIREDLNTQRAALGRWLAASQQARTRMLDQRYREQRDPS